jgi:STE24 endopeptidase
MQPLRIPKEMTTSATLVGSRLPCMIPAMSDWNFMSVIILVGLFLLWKLEFAATILNLKAFPSRVPPPLAGLMDEEKLEKARRYLTINARFGIIQSTVMLFTLLIFWVLGGFPWLDGLSRSLTDSPVLAGLIFLSAMFLGQSLISLPFSIYDTFVIEQEFEFNRSTPKTFILDRVKGLALAAVIGLPIAAAMSRMPGYGHG